jgi:nucleoside phosphorylase
MRRRPSIPEIKRLFAASGGRCAFPDCATNLILESGALLAEIAHITASSPGGPRFDQGQREEQRHGFENLILLCPNHHALIDSDPERYDSRRLYEMKALHERKIRQRLDAAGTDRPVLQPPAATQLARQIDPSVADVAIVTALPLELAAVLQYFPTLEKVTIGQESRTYYQGIVMADDGTTRYRIVATVLQGMGNVQAAAATAEIIHDWNPRYIIMCGIAAGLRKDSQQLGDVVVSTDVIYYELATLRDHGIERRPVSFGADSLLLDRAMHMHAMATWRARLPRRPDGEMGRPDFPIVRFGPVASGDKVITSAADARQLLALHSKLAAVEMEGGGVATSAFATARRVGFFMVRGISDFADQAKDDSWQDFAAHAAASFIAQFLASRPIAPADGSWAPDRSAGPPMTPNWVRTVLFPKLCKSLNMEEFRDFCFVLEVDVDDLEGTTKRAKIRELLLRAERRGRLPEIVKAYEELSEQDP